MILKALTILSLWVLATCGSYAVKKEASEPQPLAHTPIEGRSRGYDSATEVVTPPSDDSRPDLNIRRMKITRLHVDTHMQKPYCFNQSIPHVVHQIWFGNPEAMPIEKVQNWKEHCAAHGFAYRLWSNDDIEEIMALLPEKNHILFQALFEGRDFHAASDVLRVAILRQYGGVYADVDIGPPMVDGAISPLEDFFPFTNIVAMGEHHPRNITSGSTFLANGFFMAAPNHPLLIHLEDTVLENVESMHGSTITTASRWLPGPQFMTGPYFLSENIYGPTTVVPISYLIDLGMVD